MSIRETFARLWVHTAPQEVSVSIPPALFEFLGDLKQNNERDWFNANKKRYDASVKEPALAFIRAFEPRLHAISPEFEAIAKASGGSMFRIYRDTRFSKDKTPYKTHTGLQFRHTQGKDVHAPGFYLHLSPGDTGAGVGIWHPDGPTLKRIRDAIVADPQRWSAVTASVRAAGLELWGESLSRAPRGYPKDHPLIDDLKRKDFVAHRPFDDATATGPDFVDTFAATCRGGAPLVEFLCGALGLPY